VKQKRNHLIIITEKVFRIFSETNVTRIFSRGELQNIFVVCT